MSDLLFRDLELEDYQRVYQYTSRHGEGSCQHSFVTMFSLNVKYGDMICEKDGFLFVLRSRLCDAQYRVYLAPLGDGDLKRAFQRIIEDAHEHGVKAKFLTLTTRYAEFVQKEFSGHFDIQEDRGLAEYVYRTETLAKYPGSKLEKRRTEVNKFWRTYAGRASVQLIKEEDFPEMLAFEEYWLLQNNEEHDMISLGREKQELGILLEHYKTLGLSGVVLRIDGQIRGFSFGVKLNEDYYDAIIEKCDRTIPNSYRVVRQESVKQCAMDCSYVNMEEDLGIEGLRRVKNLYQPEFLITKLIAAEL